MEKKDLLTKSVEFFEKLEKHLELAEETSKVRVLQAMEIFNLKTQLSEKEAEIEKLETEKRDVSQFSCTLFGWYPGKAFSDNVKRVIGDLQSHLAALKIEHGELEKQHSDRAVYLAEKEKEIEKLREAEKTLIEQSARRAENMMATYQAIEKTIIALDQTKKIFKSKTIAQIRKELIQILPLGIKAKFIGMI